MFLIFKNIRAKKAEFDQRSKLITVSFHELILNQKVFSRILYFSQQYFQRF